MTGSMFNHLPFEIRFAISKGSILDTDTTHFQHFSHAVNGWVTLSPESVTDWLSEGDIQDVLSSSIFIAAQTTEETMNPLLRD